MSDAKIRNAGSDYDRKNLEMARQVLSDPYDEWCRHLVPWAERVVARLDPQKEGKV